jgi:hypothetical protein
MGTRNGPYNADFPINTPVRVKPREFLEEFRRTWKFHHPLKDIQLGYAGTIAPVVWFGYYFGADDIYALEGVHGIWHEVCLESADN